VVEIWLRLSTLSCIVVSCSRINKRFKMDANRKESYENFMKTVDRIAEKVVYMI